MKRSSSSSMTSTPQLATNVWTPRQRKPRLPIFTTRSHLFTNPSTPSSQESPQSEKSFVVSPSKNAPNKLLLSQWGLPEKVLECYSERGITSMFEWQCECLSLPGILTGTNLVISAPTSAGKTLVAELIALKCILELRKKVLIILPFVSLAHEKAAYLQSVFEPQGVRVGGFMGNQSPAGGFSAVDIAICTIEKANSLLNHLLEERSVHHLGVVVVDELHMIGDSHRGYLLELLLTKVLYIERAGKSFSLKIQVVGMSATLPNTEVLARWLRAQLYCTDFRPTPLREMIKIGSTLYDMDFKVVREFGPSRVIPGDEDDVLLICSEWTSKGHSVLVFCPTKAWCESLATTLAEAQGRFRRLEPSPGEAAATTTTTKHLPDMAARIGVCEQLSRTQVGLDKVLEKTVPNGVAFHHAGLTFEEREIVEGAFRQSLIKVLVTTTTLSSGVNLPARLVIVRTPYFQRSLIDVLAYRQMSGRAGRKGVDKMGESILICKANEKSKVMEMFRSTPKPIRSCLCSSKKSQSGKSFGGKGARTETETFALKRALLEVVVSGVATTRPDVCLYFSCTLFYAELQIEAEQSQKESKGNGIATAHDPVEEALEFLLSNDFIATRVKVAAGAGRTSESAKEVEDREELFTTQLGQATVASALSPEEALVVFRELRKARRSFVLENELHIIYLVTPVYVQDQWPSLDWYKYLCLWERLPDDLKHVSGVLGVQESFLAQAVQGVVPERTESQRQKLRLHRRFFSALALQDLVHEVPILHVARRYGVTKGLLQTLQSAAGTFAGMVTVFCSRLGWTNLELLLSQFQSRLTFGVERALCELVSVSLLNGARARVLFNAGYHTLASLAAANPVAIETCLRNALPFRSYKLLEEEGDVGMMKASAARTWCARLRKGLTEAEAAVLIVTEAQAILSKQLNVPVSAWIRGKSGGGEATGRGEAAIGGENAGRGEVGRRRGSASCDDGSVKEELLKKFVVLNSPGHVKSSSGVAAEVLENGKEERNSSVVPKGEVLSKTPVDGKPGNSKLSTSSLEIQITDMDVACNVDDLLPSSTPYIAKKPKLSLEEIVGESFPFASQKQPSKTPVELSPIPLHGGAETSKQSTVECSIDPAMLLSGTLSFSLAELEPARVSAKSPLVISDSFQYSCESFSSQAFAVIDAACAAAAVNDERPSEEIHSTHPRVDSFSWSNLNSCQLFENDQKLSLSPNQLRVNPAPRKEEDQLESSSFLHKSGKTREENGQKLSLSPSRLSVSPASQGEEDPSQSSSSLFPSGLKELSSLTSSQFTHCGLTVIDVTANMVLFQTFVSECLEKKAVAFSVAVAGTNRDNNIGSVTFGGSTYSGIKTLPHLRQQVVGVAFCWGGMDVYYVSLCRSSSSEGGGGPNSNGIVNKDCDVGTPHLSSADSVPLNVRLNAMRKLFRESKWKDIFAYDMKKHSKLLALSCDGVMPVARACRDPLVASWMLDTDAREKTMHEMVLQYLPDQPLVSSDVDEFDEVPLSSIATSGSDPEMQASAEAVLALMLSSKLKSLLEAADLYDAYTRLEMPSLLVLAKVEMNGIGVSPQYCTEQKKLLQGRLAELEHDAHGIAGHTFLLGSSEDVASVLYLELGLPSGPDTFRKLRTRKGAKVAKKLNANRVKHLSTAKDVLEKIKHLHPLPEMVMEWRRVSGALTKMVFPLLNHAVLLSDRSSRVYPTVQIYTATGRVSFSDPSIQMVPKEFAVRVEPKVHSFGANEPQESSREAGKSSVTDCKLPSLVSMRNVFCAGPGRAFLAADYSQLELRILAHMSGDKTLQHFLNGDRDAFRMIAGEWLGVPADKVSDQERQNAKQVCYGMIYGIGAKTLGEQLGISENEASQFIETFRSKYPTMKKFLARVVQECREKGFVTTLLGRKRYLPGICSNNVQARSQAERQAVNTTIQGSAADLVKTAMINIDLRVEEVLPCSTCLLPLSNKDDETGRDVRHSAWLVLQLHDELMYEVLQGDLQLVAGIVRQEMENALQLAVKFPAKLKAGLSWGSLNPLPP